MGNIMSLIIAGSTSGTITLDTPAVAGTQTATLPSATGTVMVSGNMPAFSAYLSSNQTGISASTWTKVNLNTKIFDTNSNFDNTTNYRFTPTIAGYYTISGGLYITSSTVDTSIRCAIYKNGNSYVQGSWVYAPANMSDAISTVSAIIYLNGTTDYVEIYGYAGGTPVSPIFTGGSAYSYLSGAMIRSA